MARYLVTGATGFLGAHLVSMLSEAGHDIAAVSRSAKGENGARVTRIAADVTDADAMRKAAEGTVGVFHCAGMVSRDPDRAEELQRIHVQGTKITLAACKEAGVKRAVVASSSGTVAVSDDPDHIATETDETPLGIIARWPYYRAKLFAERAALEMNEDGFEVISVNPTLLLGPGDVNESSTEDVRAFLERRIPFVPPGGASFVDVRDAANAMLLAMERGIPGKRYLIGACNLTVREFFGRLSRVSGVPAPVLPMPRAPNLSRVGATFAERMLSRVGLKLPVDPVSVEMAQYFWYLDSALAQTDLGWEPRDPMTTLRETVDDLRERGVVWPSAS